MADDPPSVPLRRPLTLVLTHLLAGVVALLAAWLGVSWLASGGALAPEVLGLLVACAVAPIVALLAWSAVTQWNDRVDLWADRLVCWRRGRAESYALADVERLDSRLGGLRPGVDLETPVDLRVVMSDGRVLVIEDLPVRRGRALMQLVGAVLLERWYATLRRSGSVVCADAPAFPWLVAGALAAVLAASGYSLWHQGREAALTGLRAALLLASLVPMARRAVKAWWSARRTRGVEMSLAGIAPLTEATAARKMGLEAAPYRATPGLAAATPWPLVGEVYIDGQGLWVHCANRSEPLVLSGKTENFFVVNEFIAAMRTARLSKGPQRD